MFYRIFSSKDTYITNERLSDVARTGSNFGASEILHVQKKIDTNHTASMAHILTQFDLSSIAALTASALAPANSINYRLKLTDAQHDKTLPTSFDLEIQALSQDWDEGEGRDVDFFSDKGVANWDKAKSNSFWSVAGASGSGPILTAHFDTGHENLDVDVTTIVQQWLSGNITNNGFLVKVSSSQEADSQDYYVKMFHGRSTHFGDKRPYIEARWDDSVKDDRNNTLFDVSGSLYLYHSVRGQLENIPEVGTGQVGVRVTDASGTIKILTGSHAGVPGTYAVSFALATGSYSGSIMKDIWFNLATTSVAYMTGTFVPADELNKPYIQPKKYFTIISNLKNTYDLDETVRLDMFIRPHDYNPARVLTASLDSNGTVITRGYYKIINDRTDEVVVPFGTGSLEYTRLSYDGRGNYFKIYMSSLTAGSVYRILFLLDVDGQKQYIDQGFKFRVR